MKSFTIEIHCSPASSSKKINPRSSVPAFFHYAGFDNYTFEPHTRNLPKEWQVVAKLFKYPVQVLKRKVTVCEKGYLRLPGQYCLLKRAL